MNKVTIVEDEEETKVSVVVLNALKVMEAERIIRFQGRAMVEVEYEYKGEKRYQFVALHKDTFEAIAYPILGGVSRSRISDVFAYILNIAPDMSHTNHLIGMGGFVWNTKTLDWEEKMESTEVVWRCPLAPSPEENIESEFIMQLAGGDEGHYADIMQSIAPMIMDQKPDGVIWWVGSGANGKSSLMEALYKLFPQQLASLTVKRLTDERDTPMLNGHLANIVKESSEGRIEDTQIYKSIGTHEDFRVHKFHSQESVVVRGNMHHVFSANQIPVFNDKGYSARRRTFVIPFNEKFESDPNFNERTFTDANMSVILAETIRYAIQLRDQQLRYKFSPITLGAKLDYDAEANNAEEYAKEIIDEGVVAFDNFSVPRQEYEVWCTHNGFVPLGMGNFRRSLQAAGFERKTVKEGGGTVKRYCLDTVNPEDMMSFGMGRMGFWTTAGFVPPVHVKDKAELEKQKQIRIEETLDEEW